MINSKPADEGVQDHVAFVFTGADFPETNINFTLSPIASERNFGLVKLADDDGDSQDVATMTRLRRLIAEAVANQPDAGVPPGSITPYASAVAPNGWLPCDGRAISRSGHPALFAAIGTVWGAGDGNTTFHLPDLRRRTLVGAGGAGTPTLGNSVGNRGGAETHTLSTGEMPSHSHTQANHSHTQGAHSHTINGFASGNQFFESGPVAGWRRADSTTKRTNSSTPAINASGAAINNAGGGQAHNNIQPSAVVNYIIKT